MAHFLQKEYFENEKEFAEDQACSLGETNFDFWNMFMAFVLEWTTIGLEHLCTKK